MMLDALTLPGGTITSIKPIKKMTVYEYLWTDTNAIEESGLGVRSVTVTGRVTTLATRDDIEQACESAGVKKLYFPSVNGASHDRYYKVQTHPAVLTPITGTIYDYTIECLCADSAVYLTADDSAVW